MQHKYVKKRSRGKILVTVLTAILLVLVLICAGMLWHVGSAKRDFQKLSQQVSAAAPTTQPVPSEPQTAPSETAATEETIPATQPPQEKTILPQYEQLHQQNPEFFGWLTIPDTRIDYPVMYSPEEPQKYIHADFDGNYSYPGTPFLDGHCDENSENYIIYAHNMLDGSMFRSLMKYENKAYWEKHPTIQFNTLYEEGEYEVLAAFYDKVYKKTDNVFKFYQFINAADQEDFDAAMAAYREKQLYDTGVTAQYGDQLITLVTCAYHTENGRFVVVARRAASGR